MDKKSDWSANFVDLNRPRTHFFGDLYAAHVTTDEYNSVMDEVLHSKEYVAWRTARAMEHAATANPGGPETVLNTCLGITIKAAIELHDRIARTVAKYRTDDEPQAMAGLVEMEPPSGN